MEIKTDLLEQGAILQRDKETYAVVPHIPGGILLDFDYLHKIAEVAKKYGAKAIKMTTSQRLAIVGIKPDDIDKVWKELGMTKGAASGLCVRSVKICPAIHFCKFGQQDAVAVGLSLDELYHGMILPSKFKIAVCGCMNSCTEPAVKDLGIMGTPKGFTVMIGGNAGIKPRIADVLIQNIKQEEVLPLVNKIIIYYKNNGRKYERFGKMIERIGIEEVKENILG